MLTFAPTPIGNLEDISYRTLKTFEEAEIFFCEDTRVTKKLLKLLTQKFEIKFKATEFKSFHEHNQKIFLQNLDIELLKSKKVVFVSDAGMPCISDPGATLVEFCQQNNILYDVLPGSNAVLSAFAMSGFLQKEFCFYGFLEHKGKQRKNTLKEIMNNKFVSIVYESPHRLLKLLQEISEINCNKKLFLVKELTKLHQTYYKDNVLNILNTLQMESIKGEWVVVFEPCDECMQNSAITVDDIKALDIAPKQKAKLLAKLTNKSVKEIYNQKFISS
jgi:16S rRNA (cytidine1402-2'-O)-methyltransferase